MLKLLSRYRYEVALVTTVFIWGANIPIFKAALLVLHPHAANAARFTIAALALGVVYRFESKRAGLPFWAPFRAYAKQLFWLGLLGYVCYQLFFVLGLRRTTAASASLIMASAPLWTALSGRIFGVERLRRSSWAGLLVSLCGTLLVVAGTGGVVEGGAVGNLMMLAAAVLWGSYTTFSKPLLAHVTPSAIAFFEILIALPFLLGIAVPAVQEAEWGAVTPWVWLAIFYSGALSVGLTFISWNWAVKHVGPAGTAVYGNLIPLVAAVLGFFLLGEPITLLQVVGGALLIGGLIMMRRTRAQPTLPRE